MSPFVAAGDRYAGMPYRRAGRSGLKLPAVSLGLWHNFGDDKPLDVQRAVLRRAFDLGVTHFDLANNYGPPPGSAEANFGKHFEDPWRSVEKKTFVRFAIGRIRPPPAALARRARRPSAGSRGRDRPGST